MELITWRGEICQEMDCVYFFKASNKLSVNPLNEIVGMIRTNFDFNTVHLRSYFLVEEIATSRLVLQD